MAGADGSLDVRQEGQIKFCSLILKFHRGRIRRIFSNDEGVAFDEYNNLSLERFEGVFTDKFLG
ncbi:hypothetical protein D9M70_528090 [compost metagenome]